jgi:hypothetical protein
VWREVERDVFDAERLRMPSCWYMILLLYNRTEEPPQVGLDGAVVPRGRSP